MPKQSYFLCLGGKNHSYHFGYSINDFQGVAVAAGVLGIIGNADYYRDLDGDSSYPQANTAQTAANSYDGSVLAFGTSVTKVSYRATTSALAGASILPSNYDTEAIEGFYLAAVPAAANQFGAISFITCFY